MNTWLRILEDYENDIDYHKSVVIGINVYGLHLIRVDGNVETSDGIYDEIQKFTVNDYIKDNTMKKDNFFTQRPGFHDVKIENYILEYPFSIRYEKNGKFYLANILFNNCKIKYPYKYQHENLFYNNCIWSDE